MIPSAGLIQKQRVTRRDEDKKPITVGRLGVPVGSRDRPERAITGALGAVQIYLPSDYQRVANVCRRDGWQGLETLGGLRETGRGH